MKISSLRVGALCGVALLASACVSVPSGPSMMVLPGSQTSFEQFQVDDQSCRGFALHQSGVSTEDAAVESGVVSAAVGTAVGAAAGVAIGAATGNPGAGAAIGAASGLLFGSAAGVDSAATAFSSLVGSHSSSLSWKAMKGAIEAVIPRFRATAHPRWIEEMSRTLARPAYCSKMPRDSSVEPSSTT